MKRFIKIFVLIGLLAVVSAICFGCNGSNSSTVDEDYVAVSAIRIKEANIYLAPDGAVSSYQLEPEIYPANASNRKLYYFVEPDMLKYVTVTKDGLIKAVSNTEKPVTVKIYTPDNNKAVAYVSVVVETVLVKDIDFSETTVDLTYGVDTTYPLVINYTPIHGSDGRTVAFSSQNENVVTVDKDTGLLTVKGVGTSTIIGTTTTLGGVILECRSTVRVKYYPPQGNFRLDISTQNPQYNQVIGRSSTISFSLTRLNELCDPNPVIEWYEGGSRILAQRGQWVFDYSPKITTPSTYNIKVTVTCFGEQPIELISPPITLKKGFSGFTVRAVEFDERDIVYYGETVTIEPKMANADDYKWYIQEAGSLSKRTLLGTTEAATNGGILSFLGNYEGSYTVSLEGYVGDTRVSSYNYDFEFIKYTVGDWYQVEPVMDGNEKDPESYDWFLYRYDKDLKATIGSATRVGASMENDVFSYKTLDAGTYVLYGTPVIDGVSMESEGYFAYSEPFEVFPKTEDAVTVTSVSFDAMNKNGEPELLLKWNPAGKAAPYVVELIADGKVNIFDSTATETRDLFGDYYFNIPTSIATLASDVTARVKRKGETYGASASYERNSIDSIFYPYLDEIALGMNTYIESVEELGDLLNYIFVFRPTSLYQGRVVENKKNYDKYVFRIHNTFDYDSLDEALYPTANTSTYTDANLLNMFNLLDTASLCYCDGMKFSFGVTHNSTDDSYEISLYLTALPLEYKTTENTPKVITAFETGYSSQENKRDEDYKDFAVSKKKAVGNISTSKQLYTVLSQGKRPVPVEGSAAEGIYNTMKSLLIEYVDDSMSDFEKVRAIYDYLVTEIVYDNALTELGMGADAPADIMDYAGFNLEGVFIYKSAVCDGLAKAFSSMCHIEGIVCKTIKGSVGGVGHIWNKVYIDGKWYNVDVTWGRISLASGAEMGVSYRYFLVSDEMLGSRTVYGKQEEATESYSFYEIDGRLLRSGAEIGSLLEDRLKGGLTGDTTVFGIEVEVGAAYRGLSSARDVISSYITENSVFGGSDGISLYVIEGNGVSLVVIMVRKAA